MALAISGMFLTSGCKSLLPSDTTTVNSRWRNYNDVAAAFSKIEPYNTDLNGLKKLGFNT
jgi:hypothetical protein